MSHTFFIWLESITGEENLVLGHSNFSLNGIDRESYEFLLKYRTKVKFAVENKSQRSSDPSNF